jgi:hypothetical protein
VKSFVNKKIDKLHQSILSQQTGDERASVILDAIDKNLSTSSNTWTTTQYQAVTSFE